MKLFNSENSPPCRRVRAVAFELGIPLEIIPVDFKAGDNKKPEFLAQNPNGKVPLLIDGDYQLWESNAIICYLAELHPDKGLIPMNTVGRAEVNKWLNWQNAHITPAIFKLRQAQSDEKLKSEALAELDRFAKVLDQNLSDKEYVTGLLSVVDFALASTLANRQNLGFDYSRYPNIQSWLVRIEALDSWKKSAPK